MAETIKLTDRPTGNVRELVRKKYGDAALTVLKGEGAACCGSNRGGADSCCGADPITGGLYTETDISNIPETALLASLGCGNPTALAALNPGEVVLDLGSGGGIDVLLSARRVGPTGFAFGLDMTDEMLALAERNRVAAGAKNVYFLKGHIEEIPLPGNAVDVVISNCVINLSGDKDAVIREAFRVLKPGGRFAVSDVVVDGELPAAVRADMEAYVGCIAGALDRRDYASRLTAAGFDQVSIEPTRRYTFSDLEATSCCSAEVAALNAGEKEALDGRVMGAFIRATKPLSATCCGPDCCAESEAAADERSTLLPLSGLMEQTQTTADARIKVDSESGTMTLSQLKTLLGEHREKRFRLILPDDNAVPAAFHITEVAHVQRRFIDCGGKLHATDTCLLQVWLGPDSDHRLLAGKMADVLNIAKRVLPESDDLEVEIEYEETTISQYPVVYWEVAGDSVILHLGRKHTDCLAKEVCLPASLQPGVASEGCCGPASC